MVADAEAAGFNPLTVLRNGGAAGNMTTTQPALSSSAMFGEALGEVGNFLSNFDPMADDRREQEYQLVQAQIANLNASTAGMSRPQSFNVPTYTAGQIERRPSGAAAQLSRGAGPNGEVLPIWTDWRDRAGNIVSLPNPNLPESEQFMVPVLGKAENAVIKPWEDDGRVTRVLKEFKDPVKVKKLPEGQGSWWPSFGIEWR